MGPPSSNLISNEFESRLCCCLDCDRPVSVWVLGLASSNKRKSKINYPGLFLANINYSRNLRGLVLQCNWSCYICPAASLQIILGECVFTAHLRFERIVYSGGSVTTLTCDAVFFTFCYKNINIFKLGTSLFSHD